VERVSRRRILLALWAKAAPLLAVATKAVRMVELMGEAQGAAAQVVQGLLEVGLVLERLLAPVAARAVAVIRERAVEPQVERVASEPVVRQVPAPRSPALTQLC
jgi:hypothetical protein